MTSILLTLKHPGGNKNEDEIAALFNVHKQTSSHY